MDLSRRRAAQRQGRGVHARIPGQRRRGVASRRLMPRRSAGSGIQLQYRRADFALIQKRLDVFDFDLFTVRIPGSETPGNELVDRFGSKSADTEGSSNLMGVRDPAVDALLAHAVSATTRPRADRQPARARPRAAPRLLRGTAVLLQHLPHRVSFGKVRAAGGRSRSTTSPEDWVISTWWRKK